MLESLIASLLSVCCSDAEKMLISTNENLPLTDRRTCRNRLSNVVLGNHIELSSRSDNRCDALVRDKVDLAIGKDRRGVVSGWKPFHPVAFATISIKATCDATISDDQ